MARKKGKEMPAVTLQVSEQEQRFYQQHTQVSWKTDERPLAHRQLIPPLINEEGETDNIMARGHFISHSSPIWHAREKCVLPLNKKLPAHA